MPINGNIKTMSVNLPKLGQPMLYGYKCDQLNRIVSMDAFSGFDNASNAFQAGTPTAMQDYAESYTYDPNGNIMRLTRNGTTAQGLPMDNLSYKYIPSTNQLDHVEDGVASSGYGTDITNQSAGNYGYDLIGNLISDVTGGITGITWTVYGKIQSVVKTGSTVNYTYDAGGNRISKAAGGVTTWYVRDATGNVMATYTAGDNNINSGRLSQKEVDLYGSSRIGLINRGADVTVAPSAIAVYTRNQKLFELSNHLGNVLTTVTDAPVQVQDPSNTDNVQYFNANVSSANDYYAFGGAMPGRTFSAGSRYTYGFNGKENDKDISDGAQDYGMRINDTRLGRFLSVDPLTGKYAELTPYQFASNTPLKFVDLDGAEAAFLPDVDGFTIFDVITGRCKWSEYWNDPGDAKAINTHINPLYIAADHVTKITTGHDMMNKSVGPRGKTGAAADAGVDVMMWLTMGKFFKIGLYENPIEAEIKFNAKAAQGQPTIPTKPAAGNLSTFQPYFTDGIEAVTQNTLRGQATAFHCVPTSVDMVMRDLGHELPSYEIEGALNFNKGAYVKDIPNALKTLGIKNVATYNRNFSIAEMEAVLKDGDKIVASVVDANGKNAHAIVVDAIKDGQVIIRDPLPVNSGGSVYSIPQKVFQKSFNGATIIKK